MICRSREKIIFRTWVPHFWSLLVTVRVSADRRKKVWLLVLMVGKIYYTWRGKLNLKSAFNHPPEAGGLT